MSQTDRQPDKATHWKSAIFDSGVDKNGKPWSGQWALLDTLPSFVKTVHRQKEICPDTQREHFQVHIVCHKQARPSQLSAWIKHTKWFMVIGQQHIENSINYCSKKESAVPGTHQVIQGEQYYRIHELFIEIAKFTEVESDTAHGRWDTNNWDYITARMVDADLTWASKLSNPSLRRMWDTWKYAFMRRISEWTEETGGAFIIEAPPEGTASAGHEDEDGYGFVED